MNIDLKKLEKALDDVQVEHMEITTEAIDVAELVKDFASKVVDFLSKINSSNGKILDQINAFNNLSTDVDSNKVLEYTIYGYPRERFHNLATNFVAAAKEVRSVVNQLEADKIDSATKMADNVARYLGKKNDIFKLKKDPEAVDRSRETLKDHGFSVRGMVEDLNVIKDILSSTYLDNLRKDIERTMSKAEEDDNWVKIAYSFSIKAIDEFGEIALDLGNQQLKMLKILSKNQPE